MGLVAGSLDAQSPGRFSSVLVAAGICLATKAPLAGRPCSSGRARTPKTLLASGWWWCGCRVREGSRWKSLTKSFSTRVFYEFGQVQTVSWEGKTTAQKAHYTGRGR